MITCENHLKRNENYKRKSYEKKKENHKYEFHIKRNEIHNRKAYEKKS